MPVVSKSIVTLRIHGDDLDPEEVSSLLGGKPTFSVPKNGLSNYPRGRVRIARTGIWRIRTDYACPADLDGQIKEILDQLTDDLSVWDNISNRHHLDMFCGLWLSELNEMLGISPRPLKGLGQRNIPLLLDIYVESQEENPDEP